MNDVNFQKHKRGNSAFTDYEQIPLLLSVKQLSSVLGIGRNAAYELVRSGQIKSFRLGDRIRIPKDALIEFLEEKTVDL